MKHNNVSWSWCKSWGVVCCKLNISQMLSPIKSRIIWGTPWWHYNKINEVLIQIILEISYIIKVVESCYNERISYLPLFWFIRIVCIAKISPIWPIIVCIDGKVVVFLSWFGHNQLCNVIFLVIINVKLVITNHIRPQFVDILFSRWTVFCYQGVFVEGIWRKLVEKTRPKDASFIWKKCKVLSYVIDVFLITWKDIPITAN